MHLRKTFSIFLSIVLIISCNKKIPEGPERTEILLINLSIEDNRKDFTQVNNWENRYRLPPKEMLSEEYEYLAQWQIPFHINVHNYFDEAIDGKKWIYMKLNIWPEDPNENWSHEIIFTDTTSTRNMVIPPGDSVYIYTGDRLIWDQQDNEGKSIHLINNYTPIWVVGHCYYTDIRYGDSFPSEYMIASRLDTTYLTPVDTVIAFNEPKKIFAQVEVQLFKNYHSVKSDILKFNIHYFYPAMGFVLKFPHTPGLFYPGEAIPFPLEP